MFKSIMSNNQEISIFKSAFDSLQDGILIAEAVKKTSNKSFDLKVIYANKSAYNLSDIPEGSYIDKNLKDLIGKEHISIYRQYLKVYKTGKPYSFELYSTRRNLNKWLEVKVSKLNNGLCVYYSDITSDKTLKEKIENQERYLNNIVESVPNLVWIANSKGENEYFNKRWNDFIDLSDEKSLKNWTNIIHPEDLIETKKLWAVAKSKKKEFEIEYRLKDRITGEYRWFLGRAIPFIDKEGEIYKWFGTCTDIHNNKTFVMAQEFLSETSKLLSSSINYKKNIQQVAELASQKLADWVLIEITNENSIEALAIANRDKKLQEDAKQTIKKYPVQLNHFSLINKAISTGKIQLNNNIDSKFISKLQYNNDHSKILKDLKLSAAIAIPIIANLKVFGAILLLFSDNRKKISKKDIDIFKDLASRISLTIENARLFEEIKIKEMQFNALYDSNIIGMIYKTPDHEIYQANEAFLNMIGYPKEWYRNHNLNSEDVTPQKYRRIDRAKIKEAHKKGVASPWEKEFIKYDGTLVPVIVGAVRLDKRRKTVLLFVLDITERKKLDERKDEFISIASHELKTPLTSLKGYLEILERLTANSNNSKVIDIVSKSNTHIEKINSLLSELLDVSRIQSGKLQLNISKFDIVDLIKNNIQIVQPLTNHIISLTGEKSVQISGDKQRLEQVLTNLITNAIKYSPDADKIIINVEKKKNYIKISVQDFGIGIQKQNIKKLFKRFYRIESSANKFSGLGIGLYISAEIVSRHKGGINVESEYGKGSTFYFTLPLN